ncbi:rod shape-determining protein RodA [Treponema putidum]|uniref:Peptidoglycan glycosyltransferase RodA n=1 Tax=Treponema putidum TaxID=221027 RepID=A0AAE9SJ60_9SPIR|nr:rod shape-determining protein RodA [Treponema putidum]AIN94753.1 rod shape-determining protein RodA [Treponema putidum]TWI77630.1 rod shape determining protein RodA [Treponema putidum]UTY28779.1 rod shape-determining protein RodA [Treponema putidum]UTY31207.1 rod shape-determining protein RodA [Treponema putidum]UTY33646.1 rod shape-determining protein RodA [Treponema putidum]
MNIRKITNFDYLLFLAVVLLSFIGILFIYSSGVNSSGELVSKEYNKQILWVCTGIVLLLLSCIYDYRKIKDRTFLIYLLGMLLLLYTGIFGTVRHNARSWIGLKNLGIQPSEFIKLIFILFLAYYLEKSQNEEPLKRFIKAMVIMIVPVALILKQPDLGTASVYIPIFLIMCFIAGIPLRFILYVFFLGILTIVFTLMPLWEEVILKTSNVMTTLLKRSQISLIILFAMSISTVIAIIGNLLLKRRYYYWIAYVLSLVTIAFAGSIVGVRALKEYQMMRLIIFLDPEVDPLKHGWNIIQSITAIGSGGLTGRGYLMGTQSHYRYLPEQSTDFIFSILSEEWGLLGGLFVFFLYSIVFFRFFLSIKRCDDLFGKLIVSGILAMFFFHFFVNVGMVMGIMPITGIPLLFLSYGGSSLWTAMISVGVVIGINLRQL